jgi:hypothetical protein
MQTAVLINLGKNGFMLKKLPIQAQISPVFAIATDDFDHNGTMDILLGGNFYRTKPELARYDASYCTLLLNDGQGNFAAQKAGTNLTNIGGEVRGFEIIKNKQKNILIVAKNNAPAQVFGY